MITINCSISQEESIIFQSLPMLSIRTLNRAKIGEVMMLIIKDMIQTEEADLIKQEDSKTEEVLIIKSLEEVDM